MKGMAPHTRDSCPVHQSESLNPPPNLQQTPAPVSIAAKPLSPFFTNRSSAMPIALRRPFRKVSFSELSVLDQSGSELDSTSVPLHDSQGSLSQNSGSFSRSYALKDALSNRVPMSPGYSLRSEGSETDECKVRGGHHFDAEDQIYSADSLSQLDEACSGVADSASAGLPEAAAQQQQQQHQHTSPDLSYKPPAHHIWHDQDDDRSTRGTKIHGGNLFSPPGVTTHGLQLWLHVFLTVSSDVYKTSVLLMPIRWCPPEMSCVNLTGEAALSSMQVIFVMSLTVIWGQYTFLQMVGDA